MPIDKVYVQKDDKQIIMKWSDVNHDVKEKRPDTTHCWSYVRWVNLLDTIVIL